MAHEEETKHGDRFLMDVKNSRQYVIRFDEGVPQKPFQVFAQDPRDGGFKPNEVIFALDDDIERPTLAELQSGKPMRLSTTAFQIGVNNNADPEGSGWKLKFTDVEYDVKPVAAPNGGIGVLYRMTEESASKLFEMGFSSEFPKVIRDTIDPADPAIHRGPAGEILSISPDALLNMSFPPQHDGGAATARTFVKKTSATTPTMAQDKASNDFNGATGFKPPVQGKTKVPDAAIEAVLKQFCRDLTAEDVAGKLDPVVSREKETKQAIKVLSRRKQSGLCFTGEAGVGKSAMFAAVTQYINKGEGVPDNLKNARILQLDLQAMNAGAKFRGQFEEKLKPLIDGLQEREGWFKGRKIILAIDEIHSQGTSGKAEGGTDAFNMMKPFLASKGISVMATTTGEEYKKHIEKDPALSSRFEQMVLSQPDATTTKIILEKLWPGIKEHHNLAEDISSDDIDYLVTMTNRYAPNEAQPRKSEKALDMAAASAKLEGRNVIERRDLISAVAQMSKLDENFLNQSDHERFLKMKEEIPNKVLGQPGVAKVLKRLVGARSGLNDPNQPWGCFVLQGPTGVGKTELCKALAEYLFGDTKAMIQLNMGEYQQEHTVSRLIGAPPGFVGFESAEPALTEKIRQRPYSILLLDEIEKAHPKVFDVLLPILNDGKMEDNQGKTVLFNNVIVVMTTNLGASEAMALIEGRSSMAMGGANKADADPEKLEKDLTRVYAGARSAFFRPEMVNRIEELGGFVTFIPLEQKVIENLVHREIDKVNARIADAAGANLKGVTIEVSDEVKAELSKLGYNRAMGARPLRKAVRENIADQLGEYIMANREALAKQVAEQGPVKLLIKSIKDFKPEVVSAATAQPAVSNDNSGKPGKSRPKNLKM